MSVWDRIDPSTKRGNPLYLALSFFIFLGTLLFVIDMLNVAWSSKGLIYHLFGGPLRALGLEPGVFLYLPFGIVGGLVGTLLLDTYKRWQGVLIVIALLVTFLVFYIPRAVLSDESLLVNEPIGVVITVVVAILTARLVGVTARSLSENIREYPRAPNGLIASATAVCIIGFFEGHVAYQSPVLATGSVYQTQIFALQGVVTDGIAVHFFASTVLVGALGYLTTYERGQRVIMIGPARSGKSAIFGGLHLYIRDHVETSGETDFRVNRLRTSIENGEFPDPTELAVQPGRGVGSSESEPSLLALPYRWGRFFPRRVRFHAMDYPGEALEDILADVVQRAEARTQGFGQELSSDGGQPSDSDSDDSFDVPFSDDDDSELGKSSGDESSTERDRIGDSQEAEPFTEQSSHGGESETGSERLFDDESEEDSGRLVSLNSPVFGDDEEMPGDPKESWKQATRTIRSAENIDKMIPGIRGCIHNADQIVLTVPLDDYVGPIIHRGKIPSYLEDRVLQPDELDQYPRRNIRTFRYEGETYAIKDPFNRADPEDYLYWYEALRSVYQDTDFVVVGTMADWALEDFKDAYPANISPLADGYEEFCDHVLDDVIREQTKMINGVMGGRTEGRLYLLWYDIANDSPPAEGEPLRIDTDGPYAVLRGAEQFMDRLND